MEKIKVSTLFLILFFVAELGAILTNALSLYYDTTQAAALEFMWYYLPHDEEEQPEPMEKASYLKDYDVIYVGSPDKKVIYLTFDDCPENGNIPSLLDILEKHHAPAAFFYDRDIHKKAPGRHTQDNARRIPRMQPHCTPYRRNKAVV